MARRKIVRKFKDLRLNALQDRLEEMPLSRRKLARRIGRTQGAIQAWFMEDRWPDREDNRLEEACGLPRGFFARIAAGMKYEEALRAPPPASSPFERLLEKIKSVLGQKTTRAVRLHRVFEDLCELADEGEKSRDTVTHGMTIAADTPEHPQQQNIEYTPEKKDEQPGGST